MNRATPVILRATDLVAAGQVPERLAHPVVFVATYLATRWPELDRDDAWLDPDQQAQHRFEPFETIWIVHTYLRLRGAGFDVRISRTPVPDAINVATEDSVLRLGPRSRCFLVVAQGDRARLGWGDFTIAQSPLLAARPRTALISHMPQPGLLHRSSERADRFENIGYVGRWDNLGADFRDERFARELEARGMQFIFRKDSARWNDLSDLDALLAIRDLRWAWVRTKPATKLAHAWIAGCLPMMGAEPAMQDAGTPGVDYLEVRSVDDALAQIDRLRDDPQSRRAMLAAGAAKARVHDTAAVTRQWAALLGGPVASEFERWRARGGVGAARAGLERLDAYACRVWFSFRARGLSGLQRGVLRRVGLAR